MELHTYRHGPSAAGKPQNIVVLLHGLGSNGQDLISLAPLWAKQLPNTLFVSPDAPFPCDMAPEGYGAFQWFSLQEWTEAAMLKGLEEVHKPVDNFLDNLLKKSGLKDENLALVGFSQGTMASLYVGPRRKNAIAGVLGYSGALIGAAELKTGLTHKIPTCLVHGDADTTVPITAWHQAMAQLKHAGFPTEGTIIPGLGHGIDDSALAVGLGFLRRILT